jgi:trypsin
MVFKAALVLAVAALYVADAKDVTCVSGKKRAKVTINDGDSFWFKSQNPYQGRQNCRVNYRLGRSCPSASVSCSTFNVIGKNDCSKPDFLKVISGGKVVEAFCNGNKPEGTMELDSNFSLLFKSNKKKHGQFKCTVACGSGPATTSPPGTTFAPGTCKCGIANRVNKIVGGVATEENEYPWQIGLVSSRGSTPYCGGSIISKKEILTAAHCTQGTSAGNIYILVGEHDVSKADGERKMRVCSKAEHPSYNSRTVDYDYAVLTLCDEISWATDAQPVCLPSVSGQAAGFNENKASIVSGWGTLRSGGSQPDILQEVTVTSMSNSQCTSGTAYSSGDITARMMCASASGKDSCQGDSGGPLTTKSGNNYYQTGVVSWGFGCAQANAPGVYARVTNQLDWIKGKMTSATCPSA